MSELRKCPFCAEEIQSEAIKCKHCGSALNVSVNNLPRVENKKEKEKWYKTRLGRISLWLILLFLILPLALVIWYISIPAIIIILLIKYKKKDSLILGCSLFVNQIIPNKSSKKIIAQYNELKKDSVVILTQVFLYIVLAIILIFGWMLSIPIIAIWAVFRFVKVEKKYKYIATAIILLAWSLLGYLVGEPYMAPVITISNIENNKTITADKLIIEGKVSPPETKIMCNGERIEVAGGFFQKEVDLKSEKNEFKFIAEREKVSSEYTLIINREFPVAMRADFTVNSLFNNERFTKSNIFVSGTTLSNDIELKINDKIISVKDNFFEYNLELVIGKNEIKINSKNINSGFTRAQAFTVFRDLSEEEKKIKADEEVAERERAIKEMEAQDLAEQRAWEQSRAGQICKGHPEWTKLECENLADNMYWIGMTYEMLVYKRGKPSSANPSNYGAGTHWQWCWWNYTPSCFYDNDNDGKVDSFN
jgi:hypothetical protein